MNWENSVLTNVGNSMLTESLLGKKLEITEAYGGTGTVPDASLMAQTDLVNKKQELSLLGQVNTGEGAEVKLQITNSGVTTGYKMQQIGIWATLDGGDAKLFALLQDADGINIPSATDIPEFLMEFYALIANSQYANIVVSVDPNASVSMQTLEESMSTKEGVIKKSATVQSLENAGYVVVSVGGTTKRIQFTDFKGDLKRYFDTVYLSQHQDISGKQDKINAEGILKGSGNGEVSAAIPGVDYGFPLASGSGAPTDTTEGATGQHYIDTDSGKEYVCKGCGADDKYIWALAGISDAADITYKGDALDDVLADMEEGITNNVPVLPEIVAYAVTGSVVTCTDGTTTLTETSVGDKAVFKIPNLGTWRLKAAYGSDDPITQSIYVDSVKVYGVWLSGAHVFGVEWDYQNPSTALTRLTPGSDPGKYVTETITEEPVPAVGAGEGSSPFDNYMPWGSMEEYNIIDGAVSYARGTSGFSRTDHDTVVSIPEFWCRIEDDPVTQKRRFYIADAQHDGFVKHPGSGRYIGRYDTGGTENDDGTFGNFCSKSGSAPVNNITRAEGRTGSRAKGAKWFQYDYASWCAVWLLYLVEFADWDGQAKIGPGICGNVLANAANAGGTDSMAYHTGRADDNEDVNGCQIQYRHIEAIWGNLLQWIDGVNFNDRLAYVCLNPESYADDTDVGYSSTGITMANSSGFTTRIGTSESFPWAFVPTEYGGSATTFIPDRANSLAGWRTLRVGGCYSGATTYFGPFCFYASNDSSYAFVLIGSRLLFVP